MVLKAISNRVDAFESILSGLVGLLSLVMDRKVMDRKTYV